MQTILTDFFKLTNQAHQQRLYLFTASEQYQVIISFAVDLIKSTFNPSAKLYKFSIDRSFDYKCIDNVIQEQSLFDETIYLELNYTTKPPTDGQTCLNKLYPVITQSSYLVITTDKLKKQDLTSAWMQEFNHYNGQIITIDESCLSPLINYYLAQAKLNIEPQATELLLELNQGNPAELLQELTRLALTTSPNATITIKEVKAITSDNAEYSIYNLSHAYLAGNLHLSLKILNTLLNSSEAIILINWVLAEDIRKLIKLKNAQKNTANIDEAVRSLGIWGETITLIQTANKRLNYSQLLNLLSQLSQLDMSLKGLTDQDQKLQIIQIIKTICTSILPASK